MNYIVFRGALHNEELQEIADKLVKDDINVIFFSSNGGYAFAFDFFQHLLIDYKIELVFTEEASSVAFDILCFLDCPKTILNTFQLAVVHNTDVEVSLNDNLRVNADIKKDIKAQNEIFLEKYRQIGIEEKHLRKIKRREDVCLSRADIMKLKIDLTND